jgi:NADPH:quinone reductase-like Zn-dependent oxidoreductase
LKFRQIILKEKIIMKAVRVNEWGQPVEIEEIAQPTPGNDEVLVRVRAASVNPADGAIAAGYMQAYYSTPMTLGIDFSGDVVAVGDSVQAVKPGDAVYGKSSATFADYAVVKAGEVAHKPASLDYVQAAAVPLTGLSAWQALFDLAQLQSGERILILGAGGGIGRLAVQLAKNRGAYVIAHDRADKEAFLQQLGADEVIRGGEQDFEEAVRDADVVLDLVPGGLTEGSYNVLRPGGRYVALGAMVSPEEAERRGIRAAGAMTQPSAEQLAKLAEEIDAGRLKVFVHRTFPLEETQAALTYKQQEGTPGKVVITTG